MLRDRYDLAVTTTSSATVAALDAYTADWIGYGTGLRKIFAAADADPTCALVNAHAAAVHMALEAAAGFHAARPYLNCARAAAAKASEREQLFVCAMSAYIDGNTRETLSQLRRLVDRFPADIAAAKWGQYHAFNLGDADSINALGEDIMPVHSRTAEAWGMHAFGLEVCHKLEAAEEAGRRALSLKRSDPWAQHAIAHVMEAQGRVDEGIEFLGDYEHTWRDRSIFIREHNYWHKALFHLDRDEHRATLRIFDEQLWGPWPEFAQEQIGAISALWRLELRGVDVGERWRPIVEQVLARGREHILPLQDAHFIYALARAELPAEARAFLMSASQTATRGDRGAWKTVFVPLAKALIAYAEERFETAANILAPLLPHLHRLGGSHAQRDLFVQTWIDAALKSGQYSAAADMLAKRLHDRPTVAVTRRLLARARRGQPTSLGLHDRLPVAVSA
jgi:hypothetical protein